MMDWAALFLDKIIWPAILLIPGPGICRKPGGSSALTHCIGELGQVGSSPTPWIIQKIKVN